MKKKILFLLLPTVFGLTLATMAFAENIAVIINESSLVPANYITAAQVKDIKDIYLGKAKYWGKQAIKPVNQRGKDIFEFFIKKTCGFNRDDYLNYWVKYSLDTGLSPPQTKETVKDVISYVKENIGAMGYLWESETKDLTGVKVILILTQE